MYSRTHELSHDSKPKWKDLVHGGSTVQRGYKMHSNLWALNIHRGNKDDCVRNYDKWTQDGPVWPNGSTANRPTCWKNE